MKLIDLIKIGIAKRKDARAIARYDFVSRGFYESLERLSIKTKNMNSSESCDDVINGVCSFSEKEFNYSRLVVQAMKNAYQTYQREDKQNPGMDLTWLNAIRRQESLSRKRKEYLESCQLLKKKYSQLRQEKISEEQFFSAMKKYLPLGGNR